MVSMLNWAMNCWNDALADIWSLLTASPQSIRGGAIWSVVEALNSSVMPIGAALTLLFYAYALFKDAVSFREFRQWEFMLKHIIFYAFGAWLATSGMTIMNKIYAICGGIVGELVKYAGDADGMKVAVPEEIAQAVKDVVFWKAPWLGLAVFVCSMVIVVLSMVIKLSAYGRFFKLYMHFALSPIGFSGFAGESTWHIGKAFLQSFINAGMEGAIIAIACIIFSKIAATGVTLVDPNADAFVQVMTYLGETIFSMFILAGLVKMADNKAKEMFGV